MCFYYSPEYTKNLAPPDAGDGAQIKHWFGIGIDAWLWEEQNGEDWKSGKLPSWRKRVIITHLLKDYWKKV